MLIECCAPRIVCKVTYLVRILLYTVIVSRLIPSARNALNLISALLYVSTVRSAATEYGNAEYVVRP